ncbi:amidase [Nocardioides mangrovicus]|uniref:Amidase n=1 Tax=Nocardioides mangrovicus TaxID=2478913 RepID=A0A3L8P6Z8_9ACTN|nr:amidase [Nocardioides mangrovicus]RLV51126.1 amidase [Nocardioides mangrovicus]
MTQLHELSALDQATAVRRGEVSTRELVEHHLARIEEHSSRLGAFVTLTPEAALAAHPTSDGPLAGVPTAVKDLNATAGVRTTYGSVLMRDYVPQHSDEVVLRLQRAGLVSLGKTNTPEFGSPCYTEPDPSIAPPAVTPWDTTRMAGGSSGGAATAVAAGLVPVAQGSDGGGSIRIPASCCGIVGFKPSRGVVSSAPGYGDPIGLATSGPLARTVRDAAALLDVLAGRAVGDPYWTPTQPYLAACDVEPRRLRVARFVEPILMDAEVHPACHRAWEDASRLLESLGHEVEDVPVPIPREAAEVFLTCWTVLTAVTPVPAEQRHLLRPLTRWQIEQGEQVSGPDFGRAIGETRRIAARALAALAAYDVVLTPTLAQPPLPVGVLRDDEDPEADFHAQGRFTPWTSSWNITGMPAVSLPLHQSDDGLPVGVMLAGRPGEDAALFSLAAQVEAARPWADRRPSI